MMECKEIRSLLADYAEGRLDHETTAQVADHLLLCPICAGELERLGQPAEEAPAPAQAPVAQSLGTTDPLAAQKAEDTAEVAAQEDSAEVPASAAAPKKKMRRRNKVLLVLLALLLVLGVAAVFLHSRDAFAIQDWEKTGDKSFAAVVYKGARPGDKEGFRVRLWNGKGKEWHDEVAFYDVAYRKLVWSPNGVYLAVEYTDATGKTQVEVLAMLQEGAAPFSPNAYLRRMMERNAGCLGEVPLAEVPDCNILGWLPDSSALLLAAEGVVDTEIDPDFGVTPIQPRNGSEGALKASGCLAFFTNSWTVDVLYGFGVRTDSDTAAQQNRLENRFMNYMTEQVMQDPENDFFGKKRESFFEEEALLQLHQVARDGGKLFLYYATEDRSDIDTITLGRIIPIEGDLSLLTELSSAEGILLMLCRAKFAQDPVEEAHLIIPYSGAIPYSLVS